MASSKIPKIPPAQARAWRRRLRNVIRDAGFGEPWSLEHKPAPAGGPFWAIEPTPLIIAAAEWQRLEAGLRQRARLVNAYLTDAYDRQEMLRQGLMPPEILLGDPFYRRPCLRLEPGRSDPATVLRFDLVRVGEDWRVVRTRANTPAGISYVVQTRRLLSQEAGALYDRLPDFQNTINLPLQVLDTLRRLAPAGTRAPSIVVLTAGPHDPFYTEHSFLARKMGLPLARGDDLLVLDQRVFFKTISGLEPVDVIYRRLNDAYIDPVVFTTDRETAGVTGLMQAIRAGKVVVANAIGTGVAESRALDVWLPKLARFYLGEPLSLRSLDTFTCGDTDQLDHILEHASSLRFLPAHDPLPGTQRRGSAKPWIDKRGLAPEVRQNPFAFVAQQLPKPSRTSVGGHPRPVVTLSAFVLTRGKHATVIPGGVVHLNGPDVPVDRVGVTADAIVLRSAESADSGSSTEGTDEDDPGPLTSHALGSRTAECLFWLGRYLERAEATARMLSLIDDVALEEIPSRERRAWLPLWQGLLEATGHGDRRITIREAATITGSMSWRMTLDGEHPSSLHSSVASAVFNARKVRDCVSPEAWSVLHRLLTHLDGLRRQGEQNRRIRARLQAGAVSEVLTDVNAFLGTAERTMVHDAGWRFLAIGLHLERAIMTATALRYVFSVAPASATPAHNNGSRADSPELSALLRMLGSQDAYRRLYRNRSRRREVADFFLKRREAPRSLLNNLEQIDAAVRAIDIAPDATAPLEEAVSSLLSRLRDLDPDRHFGPDAESSRQLAEFLATLVDDIGSLHRLASDHYFTHQAHVDEPEHIGSEAQEAPED